MKKAAIIYTSMTGNTEEIAELLAEKLTSIQVVMIEMDEMKAEDFGQYDGFLFGTYTDGDGELPFDTEIFVDMLEETELKGKTGGCFGSGDSIYNDFCGAVDQLQELIIEKKMAAVASPLKIELSPEENDSDEINRFINSFLTLLQD